jgi:hypothetical protein
MANEGGARGAGDHRRFVAQLMPPGELRDGYLADLDELEPEDPGAPAPEGAARREPPGVEVAGRPWTVSRYVAVAVGSVAFAYGTWVLSTLL